MMPVALTCFGSSDFADNASFDCEDGALASLGLLVRALCPVPLPACLTESLRHTQPTKIKRSEDSNQVRILIARFPDSCKGGICQKCVK